MSSVVATVLDCGSSSVKAGFAGEDAPRVEFPSLVGWPRHPGVNGSMFNRPRDNFVGPEAWEHRGLLNLRRPIERGTVTDWLDVQHLMHYAVYGGVKTTFEEHPLLITESATTTRADREKMAQILFEVFNVPALAIANQCALTLFSTGRSSGVVLESGAGCTHVAPVWEGYCQPHYARKIEFGGDDMTKALYDVLRGEGYPFSTADDMELVRRLKEELTCVALHYDKELEYSKQSRTLERLFDLPDGQQVYLNENRFRLCEGLFQPHLLGLQGHKGWHNVVNEVVRACDSSVQREMYENIVIGGGNTLFPGLEERLQREVSLIAPRGFTTKVAAFPERKYSVWTGGSILASLNTFPCMWASKDEYDDFGASIVHRKC